MKIIFWNVAGLKKMSNEGWRHINKFDIITLTETWIEEGEEDLLTSRLKNFEVNWNQATREKKKSRAKGGILLGIRKDSKREIKEVRIEKLNEEVSVMQMELEGRRTCLIATYMRRKRIQNWEEINKQIEKQKGDMLIIGGDFQC